MMQYFQAIRQWPKGIRLYIAMTSLLVTIEAQLWVRSVYGSSSTGPIRLQEIYAWISLGLLLVTLAIGPLCALLPKLPGKGILRDARRLLGISAAWFAAWHVGISYTQQFGVANPLTLPGIYQWAFLLGITALLILIALTVTSFDAAFRRLGIWWFRLHRLIYVAVLLILAHAFMIGVHAVSWPFYISLAGLVGSLFGAHFYLGFGRGKQPTILHSIVLCYGLLLTIGVFIYGYSQHDGTEKISSTESSYEAR